MHVCSFTSILIVNAEVDSMGGVIEGGLGVVDITSPHKEAIDSVQAEIRQKFDVRDIRQRELEFLEKGGNPLDYELGNAASVSVQSTSFVGRQPDKFVNSEAKCNFPYAASPHGDSVESSGRPGEPPREPSSADNLMLFDAEPILSEGDQNSLQPSRSETVPSERSLQIDGCRSSRNCGDSAAFGLPGKAYKRRNRSRPIRDGSKSILNDPNPTRGSTGSSLPSQLSAKDVKGLESDGEHQNVSLNWNLNPTNLVDDTPSETPLTEGAQQETELGCLRSAESAKDMMADTSADAAMEAYSPQNPIDGKLKQGSPSATKAPSQMDSGRTDVIQAAEEMTSAAVELQTIEIAEEVENQPRSCKMNGKKEEVMRNDGHHDLTSPIVKGLDLEPSSTQTNTSNAENNDAHIDKSSGSNGDIKNQNIVSEGLQVSEIDKSVNKEKHSEGVGSLTFVKNDEVSTCLSQQENGFASGPEGELNLSLSGLENRTSNNVIRKDSASSFSTGSELVRKFTDPVCDNPDLALPVSQKDIIDTSTPDLVKAASSNGVSPVFIDPLTSSGSELKVTNKIDEDSILKEAQIIQAKRRRIAELSVSNPSTETRQRAHWFYVLEEMAWLANDFAQERIWKMAAAAQISCRAAFSFCLKKQERDSCMEVKKVAHKLARAVMEFWLSVDPKYEEIKEEQELLHQKNGALSVRAYAVRFLKYSRTNIFQDHVEVPKTPDKISDCGNFDVLGDSHFPEEKLFYMVSPGAMQAYHKSIESHVVHFEGIGCSAPEEVETSACDAVTAFEPEGTLYDEDDENTSAYDMEAFESSKSSRFAQLKRKHTVRAYGARSYEIEPDLVPMQSAENKFMSQQVVPMVKRPGNHLNVSIPTKRVRTASRRVISPLNAVGSGSIQVPNKPDASSGDTNSYQDDQSTLRGGLHIPNSLEVESPGDFEKQFDSAEVSTKPKKRKKPKHLNADYEENWHVDSTFHNDQFERDHLKKRSDSHHLKSNGLLGQPMMKKPKIVRQSHDSSFDNIPLTGGSAPSPAASQMSNMSNPNKFIKILGGRDRLRKDKVFKSPYGQLGSGSPWSLFEDQALVVLVHDLGPNWELVSDALNSTLRFKCIFRKAKECKDRHNALMDRTSGDGGDSAEDSGSSQAYRSTLPGIPKGSARQLFQRLQGPIEEDTLKSHFEKIIMIMQKQHCRKSQDPKPILPSHSSHATALSQVCPNNLSGGSILTPLDLCDANPSGPEMLSLGYHGPHPSGLASANPVNGNPAIPASNSNPSLQGSPNVMIGSNFASSPGRFNSSMSRDVRQPVPRSASLSVEEQQRLQIYNQMISGRNMSSSSGVSSPGTERGVRTLPGGNGVRMVGGVNRSLPIVRPGMSSPSVANSGSVVSSGMSSAGINSGLGPTGHSSSVLRPREPSHTMRPGLGTEQQRQMMMTDHGSSQGVSHFGGGYSAPFANQTSPSVASYAISRPASLQQPHHPHVQGPPPNAQQQAYALRLAKERQLQQRFLQQQQQQQYAASSSLVPNVQAISSPMQNSSTVQPQTSSPASLSPLTTATSVSAMPQHPQKPIPPNPVLMRGNAQASGSSLASQGGKQRQRQQQLPSQATNRQHPQQRTQLQAQQQGKAVKGVGRGNMMVHQNISIDSSLNGVSPNPGAQYCEKGEPGTNVMQSQSLYTNSMVSPVQPASQYVAASPPSNPSMPLQKLNPGQGSSLPKNVKATSHSNNGSKAHVQPVLSASHQSVPSLAMSGSSYQQTLSNERLLNQNQAALQRVAQPNSQVNSGPTAKLPCRDPNPDQHSASTSSAMDPVSPLPQASNSSANVSQAASPASAHQWHASEQLMASNAVNSPSNYSSLVSTPSNLGQSVHQAGQGHSQKPAGSIPSVRHEVGEQWQQQQSQAQQPPSPVNQSPQQPKQPPLATNSQQQVQLQQGGSGNLYGRSDDPWE